MARSVRDDVGAVIRRRIDVVQNPYTSAQPTKVPARLRLRPECGDADGEDVFEVLLE